MKKIIGIKFDGLKQIYCYDSNGLKISKNQPVIVNHEGNLNYGTVVNITQYQKKIALPKIIRIANVSDKKKYTANKNFETYALKLCREKIKKYNLKMKLINARLTFDSSKIIFYFVSEKRIDFRQLLKDLARAFKIKIELRHIGVRDETKNIPSIGICGRPLCCNKFLRQFDTVSIKMAKDQGLSLNPMKVSGNCGRLLCCLKYEQDVYDELNKNAPQINSIVKTPDGEGKVMLVNILAQTVKVIFVSENSSDIDIKIYPLEKIQLLNSN